jgi:cell division septum initiation protein DivIVA
MTMSSTSQSAPTAGYSAPSGVVAGTGAVQVNGELADLHRRAADALRTLAEKYLAESKDAQDRAKELRAELEATEAKANKLNSESEQIRAEAERVGRAPDWLRGAEPAAATAAAEPAEENLEQLTQTAPATEAPTGPEPTHAPQVATESQPAPGPGPARGFAQSVPSTEPQDADQIAATPDNSESEDWAPKPFASWRSETKQVSSKILEL